MIGSVSVGMFKSPKIGLLMVSAHYIGAILVGIIFSFYKRSESKVRSNREEENLFKRAFREISRSNKPDIPLGIMLGNSVRNSFNTILLVGGFIILFAVVIRMLEVLKIIDFLVSIMVLILSPFNISPSIVRSFITGLFEVTMGAKMAADSMGIDLGTKVAMASFVIGWSGFSIHAQVSSIIGDTDIKYSLYILSKALHGIFSFIIMYLAFPIFSNTLDLSLPVFNSYQNMSIQRRFLFNCQLSIELFIAVLISLLIICLITGFLLKVRNFFFKKGMK